MQSALIYVRVSTNRQEDEGTSLDSQQQACTEKAEALNVPIAKVYREVYTGAELYDRPILNQVRADIRTKQHSHLFCYAIDRLSRDPIHLAIVADECARHGVELVFVTEQIDNTPEGGLIRYVRGYAAQVEREKIRERCIRGKRAIALSGRIHYSGTDLYGYRRDREAGVRVIYEPEAAHVREIFRLVGIRGKSIRGVARYLNREGIQPPSIGKRVYKDGRNPRWGKSAVYRILTESSYKGDPVAWKWKSRIVGGKQLIAWRPDSERIALPESASPAIVSRALWNQVQKRIKEQDGALVRNEARQYLLRGFIFCFKCGERMYSEPCHGERRYRCSSREKEGKCGGKSVHADKVEQFVWEQLSREMMKQKRIDLAFKHLREAGKGEARQKELREAKAALAELDRGLQNLVRKFRNTQNPRLAKAVEREVADVEREQARLLERVAVIEQEAKQDSEMVEALAEIKGYCKRMAARLPFCNFDEKTLALYAMCAEVKAAGNRYDLTIDLSAIGGGIGREIVASGAQHTEIRPAAPLRIPLIKFSNRKAA